MKMKPVPDGTRPRGRSIICTITRYCNHRCATGQEVSMKFSDTTGSTQSNDNYSPYSCSML